MTLSSDRPPFILAFIADLQGCGFHRIMMPLGAIVNTGAVDGRIDAQIWPDDVVVAAKPDVIIWQRQVEDVQLEVMANWRKLLPDTLFVYEVDDDLGEVPEASYHASYMPTDIMERVAKGMALCDRVTTTTAPLAERLRALGAKDVRVVPNGLPQERLREHAPNPRNRIRIGFAGGISHAGDLEIIRHVMATVHEEVTWVFFGMQPENPSARTEFHEGVPVQAYLDKMSTLNIDLMLAPLENNEFNRCKSNLRLIEAGAVGASVIAQDMPCYREEKPPVFAYATTPENWTQAVQRFIQVSQADRGRNAEAMQTWVGRHYTLERLIARRLSAWLPETGKQEYWKPRPARDAMEPPVIACMYGSDITDRLSFLKRHRVVDTGLEDACRRAITMGTAVLWVRPATTFNEGSWDRMVATAAMDPKIASVVPLACDGWNAFPNVGGWNQMPPEVGDVIADIVGEQLADRRLIVPTPCGPVVLLTRHALAMLGVPDVAGCDGNEEQAIYEWGLRARTRQWANMQAVDAFASSVAPPAQPTQKSMTRVQARGVGTWLQQSAETISAEDRERIELTLLGRQWGGPRPGMMGFENDYESWRALRAVQAGPSPVTDGLPAILYGRFGDEVVFPDRDANWVIWRDDNVTITDYDALRRAIATADENVCVVYADNDSLIGETRAPEFKPDFDLELFLAQDYITPICAVRIDALDHTPTDRVDLWAMLVDTAVTRGRDAFMHVPHVCAEVKINPSPETIAVETLNRQLALSNMLGDTVEVTAHRGVPGCLSVVRKTEYDVSEFPLVSIIVPTLGSNRLIQPCVATILQHTTYQNFEVIVVQNGGREKPELSERTAADPRVKIVHWGGKGFNWAAINNDAIQKHAKGQFIVTMNDDVTVAVKTWLNAMMGQAIRPDVGAVGARLLHPNGTVQHVGVVCHKGIAGHLHKGLPANQAGYLGRAMLTHESTAVTGACMLFSRDNFDLVNGFDEAFSHNYNDVVFCLELRRQGLVNVVEMTADLLHPEGVSRASPFSPIGARFLINEGRMLSELYPESDSYWNPNFALAIGSGGFTVVGLNAEMLTWRDFVSSPDSDRVLVINDLPGTEGISLDILRKGDVPFMADLSGFAIRLTAPHTINVPAFDIRRPEKVRNALHALGIDRIVLRSLVGKDGAAPPVEALRALNFDTLGIETEIDPVEVNFVAPWLYGDVNDAYKTVFGAVDLNAWEIAYDRFVATSGRRTTTVETAQ